VGSEFGLVEVWLPDFVGLASGATPAVSEPLLRDLGMAVGWMPSFSRGLVVGAGDAESPPVGAATTLPREAPDLAPPPSFCARAGVGTGTVALVEGLEVASPSEPAGTPGPPHAATSSAIITVSVYAIFLGVCNMSFFTVQPAWLLTLSYFNYSAHIEKEYKASRWSRS